MSIASDFYSTLSSTFSGRLYPSVAPASAGTDRPYATYQQISGITETVMDARTTLVNTRMQLDIFGRDKIEIDALAESAKAAMDGASAFKAIVSNHMDLFEEPQILYRVMVEWSIWQH